MPWPISMTLFIAVATLPFFLYAAARLSTALEIVTLIPRSKFRLPLLLGISWLYLLPLIYLFFYFTGKLNFLFIFDQRLHWQDYFFLYPFWFGLVLLLEIIPFYFAIDMIDIISRFKFFMMRSKWLKVQAWLKIGIVLFFAVYVAIKIYLDTNTLCVNNYSIKIISPNKDPGNLKIALLGDVQVDRYTQDEMLDQLSMKVSGTNPDLLIFAGDLVTNGKTFIPQALEAACQLRSKGPRMACTGDHDFWADPVAISNGLRSCGWQLLENQHYLMEKEGRKILITGVTHIYSRRIREENLRALLKRAPQADVKILLVHQPAEFIIQAAAEQNYHLLVAGHTHGGQVVNHIFGWPMALSRFETRYFRGLTYHRKMAIAVTSGIGLTLSPIRYHAPAEIMNISIQSE